MEPDKLFEYIIAGCVSAALALIVLLVVASFFLDSVVDSVTVAISDAIENRLNAINVNCSSSEIPDSIEIVLNNETLYCNVDT